MYYAKIKNVGRLFLLLILVTAGAQSISAAGPSLPLQCASIKIPGEHQLTRHVYARGVQMYRWNGVSWDFVAPVANLYLEPGFFGEIGFHHAGPTWESKAGSKVVATRVAGTGCTPDPTAIPWILLESVSNTGTGIFEKVSFIQRTNTKGGLAPTTPGTTMGAVVEVPYTADYYFYREVELGDPVTIPVKR
jgi:hypothetical protein